MLAVGSHNTASLLEVAPCTLHLMMTIGTLAALAALSRRQPILTACVTSRNSAATIDTLPECFQRTEASLNEEPGAGVNKSVTGGTTDDFRH